MNNKKIIFGILLFCAISFLAYTFAATDDDGTEGKLYESGSSDNVKNPSSNSGSSSNNGTNSSTNNNGSSSIKQDQNNEGTNSNLNNNNSTNNNNNSNNNTNQTPPTNVTNPGGSNNNWGGNNNGTTGDNSGSGSGNNSGSSWDGSDSASGFEPGKPNPDKPVVLMPGRATVSGKGIYASSSASDTKSVIINGKIEGEKNSSNMTVYVLHINIEAPKVLNADTLSKGTYSLAFTSGSSYGMPVNSPRKLSSSNIGNWNAISGDKAIFNIRVELQKRVFDADDKMTLTMYWGLGDKMTYTFDLSGVTI